MTARASKKAGAVMIPQEDYARFARNTEMSNLFDEMKKREPKKSNNTIYTYIGAKYECSVSSVRGAIRRCNNGAVAVEALS